MDTDASYFKLLPPELQEKCRDAGNLKRKANPHRGDYAYLLGRNTAAKAIYPEMEKQRKEKNDAENIFVHLADGRIAMVGGHNNNASVATRCAVAVISTL